MGTDEPICRERMEMQMESGLGHSGGKESKMNGESSTDIYTLSRVK